MLNKFKFDPIVSRTAINASFSLVLASSLAIYFHWELFWWAVYIAFMSIQPARGSAIKFMLARFVGTYVGGFFGALIGLTVQYPWIYYPATALFVFFGTWFFLKSEFSWAGYLCVMVGVASLLVGPNYPDGAIYYAIERCLQITFVLIIVSITLIIMRVQRAYILIRIKIPFLLKKMERLWYLVYEGYFCQTVKVDMSIKQLVREISMDLNELHLLLDTTRYEIRKKNFNSGQCSKLLQLVRRQMAMIMSIRETSRYIQLQDFSPEVNAFSKQINDKIKQSFAEIADLVATVATSYNVKKDQVEKEFEDLFDQRLQRYLESLSHHSTIAMNKIAWFTLIQRIFYVFGMMRRVVVLMNANKENPSLTKQLEKEMKWQQRKQKQHGYFQRIRVHAALHTGLVCFALILWQDYFQWQPLITMIGVIAALIISMSLIIPSAGNIGLGILGTIFGGFFMYFAFLLLNYSPNYFLVLALMFVASLIGSYLFIFSKIYNGKYMIFSLFFIIVVAYSLISGPQLRNNLDIAVFVSVAIIMATLFYSFFSKFFFPCNYRRLLREELGGLLLGQVRALRHFKRQTNSEKLLESAQVDISDVVQRIASARRSIQYCQDQEIYDKQQLELIREVTYSCELMLLADLNMVFPYMVLQHQKFIQTFYQKMTPPYQKITRNLLNYAKNIKNDNWSKPVLTEVENMKQSLDKVINEIVPMVLQSADRIIQIRMLSSLYSSFHRLFDVQIRLLKFKEFQF